MIIHELADKDVCPFNCECFIWGDNSQNKPVKHGEIGMYLGGGTLNKQ